MTPDHLFELRLLADLASKRDVRSYLEIGCRNGLSFSYLSNAFRPASRMVAVEYPYGPWNGEPKSSNKTLKNLVNVCKSLSEEYDVQLLLGNSRDQDVIKRVVELGPYDLIYIDGDHTYEGVKADWENYRSIGKIIAFDDIRNTKPSATGDVPGVHRLWNEIKQHLEFNEFAEFCAKGTNQGIGVILS